MYRRRWFMLLLVVPLLLAGTQPKSDQFTPLVASALTPNARCFPGTDGRRHLVYELILTNTNPTPATLQKIEVLDAASPSTVLAVYQGHELSSRLRSTGNSALEDTTIEFNGTRLFLIDLVLDGPAAPPARLLHHVDVLAASSPQRKAQTPVPLSYTAAPLAITPQLPRIGPPLAGKGWVALNGCCGATGIHRSSSLACDGGIYLAQRFAIDWMRLDSAGRLWHGDASDVHSYTDYDADVLAVASGTVVDTLNSLDDQKPGSLPDPKTINIANVDGNHVVLDLGNSVFAFYGHMRKNSITVAPGQRVRRGQVLGKLGNTGNTSAPHLHFHLMENSSVLCSNGIPYLLDSFVLAGQVAEAQFAASSDLSGDWSQGLFRSPSPRREQYPLDLAVVDFSPGK